MQKYLYNSDVIHSIGCASSVYAIMVQSEYSLPKLSGECYITLKEAQKFIESRSDKPKKITEYKYQSALMEYKIHILQIC